MYCLAAFIVIVALWSTPSVQSVDCTDANALTNEMLMCLTNFSFSVDEDAADYCSSITEEMTSAVSCFMAVARNCLSFVKDPAILPTNKKIIDGIDFLCRHITDFDVECFMRKQATITKCAELMVRAVIAVSSHPILTSGMCMVFDATLDCTRQHLGVCGERTKEMIANFIMDITPTECSGSPEHKEL